MAGKTYRAGIVGLGFIGGADQVSGDAIGQVVSDLDGTHVDALTGHPRVAVATGASRDEGRRERFEARTGAPAYADWREMLAAESLDIVSVATYAPFHAEVTVACARQGVRAVYCEKPVAIRVSDAERMLEACNDAGALLVVNHNRRFQSNARRLRDVISGGALGELTSASMQWGTGRLGNVGTHFIDTMQMLTGRAVEAVSGMLDLSGKPDCRGAQFRDPGGWGMLRLERGLICTVDAADYGTLPPRISVHGAEGSAVLDGRDAVLEFRDGRREAWPDPEGAVSSMDRAVSEIVDWLDGKAAFPYAASEAVRTLEAIVGFHVSHARNAAWVDLPLAGQDRDREVLSG
ncbi:MAG: Gfo/Idh/MocA family oxidoreductase [Gemmatimonadota bacterium]|nr:Gfo/Idh/MocA family oxidoreductase [Gemmatimonadota bacterium]